MGPMFVHIRYFATSEENGACIGTLEMTQDIAPLRALKGRSDDYGIIFL
jgi:uncharacterized protein